MKREVARHRERVEQACARGWSPERIARELALPLRIVVVVLAEMDEAATTVDRTNEEARAAGRGIAHGTHNGYNAHRNRGEYACEPCLHAESEYTTARRESRRLEAKARRERKAA